MSSCTLTAFLPELVMLLGALALFFVTLGTNCGCRARCLSLGIAVLAVGASLFTLHQDATLFCGAYRVDLFSQTLKVVFAAGFAVIVLLNGKLEDIREEIKPEYYLFLTISVSGLMMLVSCLDVLSLIIALEVSTFPLYLMIPMRRERAGQHVQMESAIKYVMFGIAANGVMFFGLSYLFGMTGSTSLPVMMSRLAPVMHSPLAIIGLGLTLCGLYYKLAVFPFHFWTPDVYQGASNETASLIASLPKLGGAAVMVRLVALATPENTVLPVVLGVLAVASMFFGNLVALMQRDFKRLLGFSGIAHAGYALIGLVTLDPRGYSATIFYIIGYVLMVLACFVVITRVSRQGRNVDIDEFAGLHKRSPLLAFTLAVGVFALAGMPPFVGFMGKLNLLMAAWAKGYSILVVLAMVNAAIAIYYYLSVVREAYFRDPGNLPAIKLDWTTRVLCLGLIAAIVILGVMPACTMESLSRSVAAAVQAAPMATALK